MADPPVFVVADGMGGHASGEVAAAIATEEFNLLRGRPWVSPQDLISAVQRSAVRIRDIPFQGGGVPGTTVAGVAIGSSEGEPCWLVINIGDSRVYRAADGGLEQVTIDHTEIQELIDGGAINAESAATHPRRHVVTRAVGGFAHMRPDLRTLPLAHDDRMMICSDGLTDELDDPAIAKILLHVPGAQDAAQKLVDAAIDHGGRDNVTVVVVDTVIRW